MRRPSINWQRCVICQLFSPEKISSSTSKGRFALISAITKRNDEVNRRLDVFFSVVQNIGNYFKLSAVGRFIYTKYWEIVYVKHCGNMYSHKILGITLC